MRYCPIPHYIVFFFLRGVPDFIFWYTFISFIWKVLFIQYLKLLFPSPFLLLYSGDKVLVCILTGLELLVLLTESPKCWIYRYQTSHFDFSFDCNFYDILILF